ncbi:proline--tRNA ligase [archaeon]|nr:proline--tRNA ligase [archaeon]|tara:strand:- start:1381 stop:2823 length:1443 start_codon:yes stop_codon:yes gene_type:complete
MSKKDEKGISISKEKDFSKWYTELIQKADLADYTKVSGCIVFKPKSFAMWEKVMELVNQRIKKLNVKNVYFPLFIPEEYLSKEATHVEGFTPEVAWVTHAGKTKLNERLAIRPTSETIMYPSFSKWIRSYKDLPLKYNQWSNVVRWEFNNPVPFFRTREFLFNEGHTVFATQKEAEAEGPKIIDIYKDILENYMALPNFFGKKTEREKFAGAEYTWSLECYLPNGKAIQGPDFHHDGQIFAKAYDIKFIDKDEKEKYVWQNTWAISTRMLGVMFAMHSDDKGLILPPKMADEKIGIIPILFEDSKKKVLAEAKKIKKILNKYGVFIDDREEYTPGWKFNEIEMSGTPLRIEIGPRDLLKKEVVVVKRNTSKKYTIKISQLTKEIPKLLDEMQNELYEKAEKLLKSNIVKTDNYKDIIKLIKNKKLILAPMCINEECEDQLKDKTTAKVINIPLEQPSLENKKCIICNKQADYIGYIGKSY